MTTSEGLFAGAAEYYAKFRPGYPAELFDHLRTTFNLDGSGTLVDLGCGTGQLTVPLRADFSHAVGVDTDADMLRFAQLTAEQAGVDEIEWRLGKAEEVLPQLSTCRLATAGRSFHWMNAKSVLTALERIVEPTGGVAIITDNMPRGTSTRWSTVLGEIVTRYLGETRYTAPGVQAPGEHSFSESLRSSAFSDVEVIDLQFERTWNADSLIGYLHSTSFAAPKKFGERLAEFHEDVRQTFSDQQLVEGVRLDALLAKRPL